MNRTEFLDLIFRADEGLSASHLRVLAYMMQLQEYAQVEYGPRAKRMRLDLPTVSQIAFHLNWPRQTASTVVAKLASAGYVTYVKDPNNAKNKYLRLIDGEQMERKKLMAELADRTRLAAQYEETLTELLTEGGYLEEGQDVLSVDRHKLKFLEYDWDRFDQSFDGLTYYRQRIVQIEEWLAKDKLPKDARAIPGLFYSPFAWVDVAHEEKAAKTRQ